MRNSTEKQPTRLLRLCTMVATAILTGLLFMAPMASAQTVAPATQSTTTMAPDPLSTGSIGTTANQARAALQNNGIDRAVASSLSSVQIPSYLSMLADRRILVLLSLIGLFVVWINRAPASRDDNKN